MNLHVLAGRANAPLAEAVARRLGLRCGGCIVDAAPDGELRVRVEEDVRGGDVYIVQPTGPPVGEHLLELCLLADACRGAGAARVTAVVPYLGYARHDRREAPGEPLGARLVAELLEAAGLHGILTVDLHTPAVEGCFRIAVEHLSAVELLADALRPEVEPRSVIVAPDLGAVKLAERYGALLDLPVAVVHKRRLSHSAVSVRGLVGEIHGGTVLLVDDMIATGSTIEAAVRAVLDMGRASSVTVAATHGLLVGDARDRLARLPLRRLVITDSIEDNAGNALPLERIGLAPLIAHRILQMRVDARRRTVAAVHRRPGGSDHDATEESAGRRHH